MRSLPLLALCLSLFSALLLCAVFFIGFLTIGLYETRGELGISVAEFQRRNEITPFEIEITRRENLGLAAFAWQLRERPIWTRVVAFLYRQSPALRTNNSALLTLIISIVLCGFLRAYLLIFIRRISERKADEITMKIRESLHRQSLRLEPGDIEDRRGEEAVKLFIEDITQLRNGIARFLYRVVRYPVELVFLFVLVLMVDWRLALQASIPLAGCWLLLKKASLRHEEFRRKSRDDLSGRYRLLAEGLRNSRTVRGYSMEEFEHEQFRSHLGRYSEESRKITYKKQWARFLSFALVAVCFAALTFLIGFKLLQPQDQRGTNSLAATMLTISCFAGMYFPLERLMEVREIRHSSSLFAQKIFRYLDTMPDVSQAVGAKFLQPMEKSLQFDSVVYRAGHNGTILNGLSLDLLAGTSTAIVSIDPLEAKAAMLMLPRFIEPTSGRILIDNEDISWVTLESLRAEAIFVGGNRHFFTGSVLENIRCGDSQYSLQDAIDAAKKTHAHQFIQKLRNGYETVLGYRGEELNAGEAFLVGLARALLRNPAILIIEEPKDEMTANTKSLLDDAYQRLKKNRTLLFLPQRLSTVKRSDRILLLSGGKVAAEGAHAQLVKESNIYRHWEYVRFNEFGKENE